MAIDSAEVAMLKRDSEWLRPRRTLPMPNIYDKLGVSDRAAAVVAATESGMFTGRADGDFRRRTLRPIRIGVIFMAQESSEQPFLPPRWFIRAAWYFHRAVLRVSGGRLGLWRPKPDGWGTVRLTTVGRRTGRERMVVVGYFEDGPDLVTMAMNGWGEGEPAWWLNLQAHPDARVELKDGERLVTGRAAEGEERERLWARWAEIDKNLDAFAARRPSETAVVILEPR